MTKSTDASSSTHQIPPQDGWSYESTVAKVEAIIQKIELGELELAEIFNEFATAVEYLQQCETFLQQRRQQMDLLVETLKDESESF